MFCIFTFFFPFTFQNKASYRMPEPVVHHVEICVSNLQEVVDKLAMHGFRPYAKKTSCYCEQLAVKLGDIIFVVTQRSAKYNHTTCKSYKEEFMTVMCDTCELTIGKVEKHVNTVFNVALNLKDLRTVDKIRKYDGNLIHQDITTIEDDSYGALTFAIVKSKCKNVVHTLLCKTYYKGFFLPGFVPIEDAEDQMENPEIIVKMRQVKYIDHVTLALDRDTTDTILHFYRKCFGMEKFVIKT